MFKRFDSSLNNSSRIEVIRELINLVSIIKSEGVENYFLNLLLHFNNITSQNIYILVPARKRIKLFISNKKKQKVYSLNPKSDTLLTSPLLEFAKKGSPYYVKKVETNSKKSPKYIIILVNPKNKGAKELNEIKKSVELLGKYLLLGIELIESNNELNKLKYKNNTLEKIVRSAYPHSKNHYDLLKEHGKSFDAAYMVMDIRNSTAWNEHFSKINRYHELIEFYARFKDYCDKFAIRKYNTWFRKQIGDRLDYAWKGRDAFKTALNCGMDIMQNLDILRSKIPKELDLQLGLGIALGKVVLDIEVNELKGDPARLANELQEKRSGIFTYQAVNKDIEREVFDCGWIVKNVEISARGTMKNAYQILYYPYMTQKYTLFPTKDLTEKIKITMRHM